MSKQIQINLPEKLGSIFVEKKRYRGAYGGRGSGKSIGFAEMALMEMMREPMPFLFCRELQNSMKDSVHTLLVAEIMRLGLQDVFTWGESFLRCKNGSYGIFKGLRSNAAEIKSMHGIKRCWVEEAQSVSQKSLDYLLPTIRENGSEIWFTWNPEDELDPVHDMLVTNKPDNAAVVKINWNENPFFPDVLNEERLRVLKYQPQRYDWIWNGNFNTNTEGAVYGKWIAKAESEGRVVASVYDPSLPVFTAWDLGFSDDTAIWWWQVYRNEVRFIDYYENNRESLKHYAEQVYGREIIVDQYGENGKIEKWHFGADIEGISHRKEYKYADHFVPHDAVNKLLAAGGRSIVHQLHELGVKTRVVAATSQQNQIEAMRSTLDLSWFDKDRCKDGIRSLRKYQFLFDEDRNKYLDKPDHDAFSHGCDAAEIVAQVWKSAILSEAKPPPKFFEQQTINELFYGNTGDNSLGYERI